MTQEAHSGSRSDTLCGTLGEPLKFSKSIIYFPLLMFLLSKFWRGMVRSQSGTWCWQPLAEGIDLLSGIYAYTYIFISLWISIEGILLFFRNRCFALVLLY